MTLYAFRLPDIGEGVVEAEIAKWHVVVGQAIEEDQPLVDVMTNKATVEMTSPVPGRVVSLHGEIGLRVPVGSLLVELALDSGMETAPADAPVLRPEKASRLIADTNPIQASALPARKPNSLTLPMMFPAPKRTGRPLASPAVRRRAYESGIALQPVIGTGPGNRITAADFDAYLTGAAAAKAVASSARRNGITETRIVGLRRLIADKMQEAKRHIPHFTYVEELDLTELEALRSELNAGVSADRPKLTLLPFFMLALLRLVRDFPQINARYDGEAGILRCYEAVHIGIATQTPAGLMVPVIRHAEELDIWALARELLRTTAAARQGTAKREELSGSTITLTSLGALGGIAATPIINHPEVAVIGPNKLVERPAVSSGRIVIRKVMNLSSSFDHRIIDGYEAANFIQRLKRLIERPALLFVEQN